VVNLEKWDERTKKKNGNISGMKKSGKRVFA